MELNFQYKDAIYSHHRAVPVSGLEIDEKKSIKPNADLDGNLIIQGDNLYALKALLPQYAGRVDCIYIDPPYNTGGEWAYSDKVDSEGIRDWFDSKTPIDKEDLERHDKWLCMMWPRLQLLHELLADDGAIFISIDDNEQHRLRAMMDEIFGKENFVANIIWQKKLSPQNDAKWLSDNHDFILLYAKNKEQWFPSLLPRTEKHDKRYKNPDNDPRGRWAPGGLDVKTYQQEYDYPITTPSGRVVSPPPGSCWRLSKDRLQELVDDNRIWFGSNGSNVPTIKRFLSEVKQGITPLTIWTAKKEEKTEQHIAGQSQAGIKELRGDMEILGFDNPKPSSLLKRIISIATTQTDSIILDSFAGSGTTAHATLALNKEDGGKRKFILVEMEDYANKITAERVRRVIKGVKGAKDKNLQKGLGGDFTYCTLGQAIEYNKIVTGKNLPKYEDLARLLFLQATGKPLKSVKPNEKTWLVGETDEYKVFLIYKKDKKFLESMDATLKLDMLERISPKLKEGQKAIVFASGRCVDSDMLRAHNTEFLYTPRNRTT